MFPLSKHGLQIKAKQPLFYCEGVKHDTYVTRSSLNPIPKYLLDYVEGILNLFDLFTKKDHKHFEWAWFESDEPKSEKVGKSTPTPPHNCDGITSFPRENHIEQVKMKGKGMRGGVRC